MKFANSRTALYCTDMYCRVRLATVSFRNPPSRHWYKPVIKTANHTFILLGRRLSIDHWMANLSNLQTSPDATRFLLKRSRHLDEDENEKSARGIGGFGLVGGKFGDWKVQGKLGGYTK